jgi:hypothetical protein
LTDVAEIEATVDKYRCLAGITAASNRAGLAMRLLPPGGGTMVRGIEVGVHVGSRATVRVEWASRRNQPGIASRQTPTGLGASSSPAFFVDGVKINETATFEGPKRTITLRFEQ